MSYRNRKRKLIRAYVSKNLLCSCGLWISQGTIFAHARSPRHMEFVAERPQNIPTLGVVQGLRGGGRNP